MNLFMCEAPVFEPLKAICDFAGGLVFSVPFLEKVVSPALERDGTNRPQSMWRFSAFNANGLNSLWDRQ